MHIDDKYKVRFIRIGNKETKLYELERERNEILRKCAEEWKKIVDKFDKADHDFWGVAVTTAIYDLLHSLDKKAGITACKCFLERMGHEIS